jgi:hypothetical protein
VENLRAALGGTPEGLTVYPVEDWYETSARTRDKFARWALERTARSGRIRLIGEQPWALGNKAQVRDWARYESVINVAFAGLPCHDLPIRRRGPAEVWVMPAIPTRSRGWRRQFPQHLLRGPRDFCGRLDATVGLSAKPLPGVAIRAR